MIGLNPGATTAGSAIGRTSCKCSGGGHPLHSICNEHDWHPSLICSPVRVTLGFPDVLEIPIHGWHDCVIRDEVLGWEDVDG